MPHGRDMRARRLRPLAHAVRVLARVLLDRVGRAAVRITLPQNGVHRAAETFGVAVADFLVLVGLRTLRIVRNLESLALQFLDRGDQLRHRGADVGQLDDVGVGQLRQLAQFAQVVGHALLVGQVFGELGQDPCCHRDVTGLDLDARRFGEGTHDRQERVRRQQRRLVGQRVDDGRLFGAHGLSPGVIRSEIQGLSVLAATLARVFGLVSPRMEPRVGTKSALCDTLLPRS